MKETERPDVKQVIVRKEDVSHRAEEPQGSSLFSIKQKMKVWNNIFNFTHAYLQYEFPVNSAVKLALCDKW